MSLTQLRTWARTILHSRDARPRPRGPGRPRLEWLEDRLTPDAVSWTGGGDGVNWGDARNWSTATRLPGPADDVTIDAPGTVILHASGSDSVHSLNSENAIVLSGGSLALAADSAVDNTLVLNGGTLTAGGPLSINALEQTSGTLNGAGTVTIQTQWDWGGGTQSGSGHTALLGSANLGSGSSSTPGLSGRVVDNDGTATLLAHSVLTFSGNAVWNNQADGTFVLQGSDTLLGLLGPGQFNNAGLVLAQAADAFSTSLVYPAFNNTPTGTVDVQGFLALEGGGSSSGTFDLEGNGGVLCDSTYNLQDGATSTGSGMIFPPFRGSLTVTGSVSLQNLVVSEGTVTVNAGANLDVQDLRLDFNGTLTGPGDVTVENDLTWVDGTMAGTGRTFLEGTTSIVVDVGLPKLVDRTVNNDGVATIARAMFQSSFTLSIQGNGVWNNDAGATTVLQGMVDGFMTGPRAAFHNAGLLQKTGTAVASLKVPLSNADTGTIDVQAGTLQLSGSFQTSGAVTIEPGATFLISTGNYVQTGGTTTVDGALSLSPVFTVSLNGGLLTGGGTINGSVVNAAELRPGDSPGVLTINGNYTQTADGVLDIEIGGPAAGQYDRLVINGTAALAGTLNVVILNGYVPDPGTAFQVLSFHSHRGDFDLESGLDLGGGLTLVPSYNAGDTGLSLVATQSG
jgi:hypothetical protein